MALSARQHNLATGTYPLSVTANDFNKDGNLDLAVANYGSHTVSVFLGNGNGSFGAGKLFPRAKHPSP
ncbi:MAG: VCBS repeat-containing protein [Chromatiales bacterium]|nr:VCBS repeat-containing protein [Chromatiales bacterium]